MSIYVYLTKTIIFLCRRNTSDLMTVGKENQREIKDLTDL